MRRLRVILAAGAGAMTPGLAQAHLIVTGLGPLYDGAIHFSLSPEDVLPVLALGLFAGLRGQRAARLALAATTGAIALGGLIALGPWPPPPPEVTTPGTAALLLILGGLLAADAKLAPPVCALLAAAVGLFRGWADLAGATSGAALMNLSGMCAAAFVGFALAVSLSLPLTKFWMIIAARVAGSWVAAAGLLLAGWILRFGARVQ